MTTWRPCSAWARSRRSGATRRRRSKRFEMAISIDPRRPKAHYLLGRVREAVGQTDEALAAYFRALEFDANDAESIVRIAAIQLARSQPDQALSRLDQAIELVPDDGDARALRGLAHWKLHHIPEAIADLRAAAQRLPEPAGRLLQPRPGARGRPQAGRCPFRRRNRPSASPRPTPPSASSPNGSDADLRHAGPRDRWHAGCSLALRSVLRRCGRHSPRTAMRRRQGPESPRPRRPGCARALGRPGPGRLPGEPWLSTTERRTVARSGNRTVRSTDRDDDDDSGRDDQGHGNGHRPVRFPVDSQVVADPGGTRLMSEGHPAFPRPRKPERHPIRWIVIGAIVAAILFAGWYWGLPWAPVRAGHGLHRRRVRRGPHHLRQPAGRGPDHRGDG